MGWWVRDWFVDEEKVEKVSGIQRLNGWMYLLVAMLSGTIILSGSEPEYVPSSSWGVGLYAFVGLFISLMVHTTGRRRDAVDAVGTATFGIAALHFASVPSLNAPSFHYPAYVFLVFSGVAVLFRSAAVATGSHRRERERWNRLLSALGSVAALGFLATVTMLFWPLIRGWV